ncbi:hypothetical protein FGO68_gene4546 [Halteria grandinella]|uniref:Uncharacterized protein n=1 Tax=Halteria grandinella TaxID=5974 RepID=A0A8J8NR58_HALGN|nr:hypothetical protein FGO68_gene4546 [Halteria grandinella]
MYLGTGLNQNQLDQHMSSSSQQDEIKPSSTHDEQRFKGLRFRIVKRKSSKLSLNNIHSQTSKLSDCGKPPQPTCGNLLQSKKNKSSIYVTGERAKFVETRYNENIRDQLFKRRASSTQTGTGLDSVIVPQPGEEEQDSKELKQDEGCIVRRISQVGSDSSQSQLSKNEPELKVEDVEQIYSDSKDNKDQLEFNNTQTSVRNSLLSHPLQLLSTNSVASLATDISHAPKPIKGLYQTIKPVTMAKLDLSNLQLQAPLSILHLKPPLPTLNLSSRSTLANPERPLSSRSNISNAKSTTSQKPIRSYLSTAEEMKDFLENKLKPVEGLFCVSNYYRNNYTLANQEVEESAHLSQTAILRQSQRSVSQKREPFKLGELLPHPSQCYLSIPATCLLDKGELAKWKRQKNALQPTVDMDSMRKNLTKRYYDPLKAASKGRSLSQQVSKKCLQDTVNTQPDNSKEDNNTPFTRYLNKRQNMLNEREFHSISQLRKMSNNQLFAKLDKQHQELENVRPLGEKFTTGCISKYASNLGGTKVNKESEARLKIREAAAYLRQRYDSAPR